jgi:hypothetical protein
MAGQLIPPPELDPPMHSGATPGERIKMWFEMLDLGDDFFLAGLQMRKGPDADWKEEYRQSYAEHLRDHDEAMLRMMQRFRDGGRTRAR